MGRVLAPFSRIFPRIVKVCRFDLAGRPLPLLGFATARILDAWRNPKSHDRMRERSLAMHTPATPQRRSFLFLMVSCLLGSLAAASGGCQWASSSHNAMGTSFYEQGQYSAAMQEFQQAVTANPADPDGYYNLAALTHRQGVQRKDAAMLERAEALYNQCLDHAPDHIECHRGLAVLLVDSGRTDKAFTLMKNWAAENPQLADARIELARLYDEHGDPQQARKYLEDAVQIDPNNSRGWLALGKNRENSGDLVQALANYQRGQSLVMDRETRSMATERIALLNRRLADMNDASLAAGATRMAQPPSTSPVGRQRY